LQRLLQNDCPGGQCWSLLDLVRALVALALPFVTEVWQIYVLISSCSPLRQRSPRRSRRPFQTYWPDEDDYTRALSLSRLAYDLESVASPMLAAALLTVDQLP